MERRHVSLRSSTEKGLKAETLHFADPTGVQHCVPLFQVTADKDWSASNCCWLLSFKGIVQHFAKWSYHYHSDSHQNSKAPWKTCSAHCLQIRLSSKQLVCQEEDDWVGAALQESSLQHLLIHGVKLHNSTLLWFHSLPTWPQGLVTTSQSAKLSQDPFNKIPHQTQAPVYLSFYSWYLWRWHPRTDAVSNCRNPEGLGGAGGLWLIVEKHTQGGGGGRGMLWASSCVSAEDKG